MLRALWFALKVALIVTVAIWVASRPGTVSVDWLGYQINAHVGFVLVALLVFVFVLLFFHRLALAVLNIPGHFKQRRVQGQRQKGYRALMRGLSAVAAGDAPKAIQQAERTRKYWPDDQGLSLLLEAHAARLEGDNDKAQHNFSRLMDDKDTAFLGLRGLMSTALEDGRIEKALHYARKALALHPHQPRLLHTVYDLELELRDWDSAQHTLRSALKHKAIPSERAHSDKLAMLMHQADLYQEGGQDKAMHKTLAEAHKLEPGFVPAALALARFYRRTHKRRKAVAVIESCWMKSPHPELAAEWRALVSAKKGNGSISAKLDWAEKLVALRPDSFESQIEAANAAFEDGLMSEARQYLDAAGQIKESPRLYRLWARLAEKQGRPAEAAEYLERAADAPADDVWYCTETGRLYEHWTPIALPHGRFNTIVWGQPKGRMVAGPSPVLAERSQLLLKDSGVL